MMINHPFKTKEIVLETNIQEFKTFFENRLYERGLKIPLYAERNANRNKLLVYPNVLYTSESSEQTFKELFGNGGIEVAENLLKELFGKETTHEVDGDAVFISIVCE